MSYRCVVIDDEKPARERLKRMLAAHEDFEVAGEAPNADAAVRLIDELQPDLCFLDVQMPEGDGFEVLRRVGRLPAVIFTTAFDQYAVRAFEVNSVDYLLKPFSKARFAEALERFRRAHESGGAAPGRILGLLERIRDELQRDSSAQATAGGDDAAPLNKITARRGTRILLLDPGDVLYFEAEDTLVFARTAEGRFLVERTLALLEERLAPAFFRCHRRFIVNLGRIAEILPGDAGTYSIVLRGESRDSVPLSRRQARKLKEMIPW